MTPERKSSMTNLTEDTAKKQLENFDKNKTVTVESQSSNLFDPASYENFNDYWNFVEQYNPNPKKTSEYVESGSPAPKKHTPGKSVKERKPIDLPPWTDVQLTPQGNYGEVIYMAGGFHGATIKPIDKERYQVVKTGEIRFYDRGNETKIKNNLTKTFRELVGILRLNFTAGKDNQVFMTLTYARHMTDPDTLYEDFAVFWKRITRHYKDHKLEYVAIAEPQGSGSWHMHVMIKSDQPVLYIDNKLLTVYKMNPENTSERLRDENGDYVITGGFWGWGRTSTERLKGDDVGQYYAAYFTNVIVGADGNGKEHFVVQSQKGQKGLKNLSKKVIKGARIAMYPKHFKLYRCSKGIIRPKSEMAKYEDVKKEYPIKTKPRH